jgi:hypothetical protein
VFELTWSYMSPGSTVICELAAGLGMRLRRTKHAVTVASPYDIGMGLSRRHGNGERVCFPCCCCLGKVTMHMQCDARVILGSGRLHVGRALCAVVLGFFECFDAFCGLPMASGALTAFLCSWYVNPATPFP